MDAGTVLLLLAIFGVILMLAWVIGTTMRIESKLDPILSSTIIRTATSF